MKVKYIITLGICLISQIISLSTTRQDIVYTNVEFPKVCPLEDGNVLVLTSKVNEQKTQVSKFDSDGRELFNDTLNYGYSPSAEIVEPKSEDGSQQNYHLFFHNKQNVNGNEGKEFVLSFKDKGEEVKKLERRRSIYQKTSAVPMKNGKIVLASIKPISSDYSETSIELNIYDPADDSFGTGITLNAYSQYISCYEQKENDVYCVYVSFENPFVSKLRIKRLQISNNIIVEDSNEQVIKAFYTQFNFLKAVRFNDTDALILFQTGNGKTNEVPFGNSGKDLYYYHIQTNSPSYEKYPQGKIVFVQRYEYLFNDCIYNKDPEYYNADIYPLSKNRIFAVCEYEENKFRGFIIYPGKKTIDRFNFNNFEASSVKTPVFTKFGNTLALFYTYKSVNLVSNVAYQMINYPYCEDQQKQIIPIHKAKKITMPTPQKMYLINPYPASRANEQIYFRFIDSNNSKIYKYDTNEELLFDKDYIPENPTYIKISSEAFNSFDVQFAATLKDPLDGIIIGKTCKIPIETPECLDQCYSCNQTGTEKHHFCLGCKEKFYYKEEDPLAIENWYGRPHNCRICNESCSTCFGPFIDTPKNRTTNCKICNYEENYFPFEGEKKTCISNGTRSYWEEYLGPIYLDKTGGEEKEKWIWRKCHENCAKCEEGGDDIDNKCLFCKKDLYFFCNQTLGHGIPGSCYSGCINNGFYKYIAKDEENREKCCPCLEHCKECQNETICDLCEENWFKTPDSKHCNGDCGYCLAKDVNLRECVNCKTRYDVEKYNHDGYCNDTLPFFNYTQFVIPSFVKKEYHVIDETCNLIEACKEGCFKCERFTDKCTECSPGYYKEDFFGKTQPKSFRCFSKTVCQGVTQYPHDKDLRVGGVPLSVFEEEKDICLNCKLRNDSYRQPENDFYCGDKIARTFVDIEDYNKLSKCYFRCKECDNWGNSILMNCSSCRDGAYYDLIKPDIKSKYGNCYRKSHKCGIYPYYHDYDLAEYVGKDEDDCGEDCDVCLYNFSCTENFPYFVYETHECVEYCPITEVLSSKCNMNNTVAGIILLKNPFGLRHPYDFINNTISINQFISSSLFQYFAKSYNLDVNSFSKDINNYLGNGKIYNLPESKIIIGNNISIELTTVKLELEKLKELITGGGNSGGSTTDPGTSILDISACEALLKKKYGLSDEEDLMVVKGDILKTLSEEYFGSSVEYQLFSTSLGAFLPLSDCQEGGTSAVITSPYNPITTMTSFQSKSRIDYAFSDGYNALDTNSPFYNDICTPFTNENGNDVLIDDRRKDYFNETFNLCEEGCEFLDYNASLNMYSCKCGIKAQVGDKPADIDIKTKEIPEDFKNYISRRSNIKVFKCASQVFSSSGQKKNFGSYILLACLAGFIGIIVFHFIKEKTKMDDLFFELSIIPTHPANPPKPSKPSEQSDKHNNKEHHHSHHKSDNKDTNAIKVKDEKTVKSKIPDNGKTSKQVLSKPHKNPVNVQKDLVLEDDQLNFAGYDIAFKKDRRTFIQYYWSLLKMKQLFIFTFYTSKDYILRSTKIALFILFISFYFAFTALFFNDSIMRQLYVYKGNTDAAVHVPNIILSSLCCIIMNLIVRFVCLNERDIIKITQENNPETRKSLAEKTRRISKLKLIIFFIVSGILIALCWYYVSAFCAVFKNSQGRYLLNVFIAFLVCNIWPCVTSLIPALLRINSLKTGTSETLYKISQIISLF